MNQVGRIALRVAGDKVRPPVGKTHAREKA